MPRRKGKARATLDNRPHTAYDADFDAPIELATPIPHAVPGTAPESATSPLEALRRALGIYAPTLYARLITRPEGAGGYRVEVEYLQVGADGPDRLVEVAKPLAVCDPAPYRWHDTGVVFGQVGGEDDAAREIAAAYGLTPRRM